MFRYLLIATSVCGFVCVMFAELMTEVVAEDCGSSSQKIAELESKKVKESSGVAIGRANGELFWTHNDSGDKARLYVFDRKGKDIARYLLEDVDAIDIEDMASFTFEGKHYLLVGDVGDNEQRRAFCSLYLVEEPAVEYEGKAVKGELPVLGRLRFRYEDGPGDCEAVAVDAVGGEIILVSKELSPTKNLEDNLTCRVYTLPLEKLLADGGGGDEEIFTAKIIAELYIPIATAADISADGKQAIVGTYFNAFEFYRGEDESWGDAFGRVGRVHFMPLRRQGESICYSADGGEVYLTSEGRPMPFWEVVLPHDGE